MRMAGVISFVLMCGSARAADTPRFDAGQALYRAGRCAEALPELARSEAAGEAAPERAFYQGVCLAKRGEWARAGAHLAAYTTAHPGEARGWYWLAQVQLYQKQFSEAKASADRAIGIDGQSADSFRTLGEIDLELKDYDGAYRAWVNANKLNPKDARTTYYIGRLFFEADFLNEAAAWLRETLKLAPHDYAAMTYLAMCGERLDFKPTAIDLYRAAIRESKLQKKPYPWAYLNLAKLVRELGREEEAFALLEEAERLCPEAHALAMLGQTLIGRDQKERAEQVLRRAISMDGSIPDAHYRLALLLRSSGRTAEAQAEMQKFQQAKDAEERNKPKIQAVRKNG